MSTHNSEFDIRSDGDWFFSPVALADQEVSFRINIEWHGFHKAMEAAKEMSRNIPHLIHYYCTEILQGYTPRPPIKAQEQEANFAALIQALGFDQALEEIKHRGYDIETILKDHFAGK